jgi:hypothetical protein
LPYLAARYPPFVTVNCGRDLPDAAGPGVVALNGRIADANHSAANFCHSQAHEPTVLKAV